MKIVIDIPEQMYINAKTDVLCGEDVIVSAIKNGTPLPKGHGRLIDVSDLFNKVRAYASFNDACELEDSLSTIIEADRAESEDKE